MLSLFQENKERKVQSLMLNLVNNRCRALHGLDEGPRLENRVNLTVVVLVIPIEKGRLVLADRFPAVTMDFSSLGVSLVLHECRAVDRAILGFRDEGSMHFVLAEARHLNPLGGGFWQLGLRLKEVVDPNDYPELAQATI